MVVAKVHVGGKLLLADGTATLTGLGAGSLVAVGIAMLVLRRAPAEVAGARLTPAVPLGEGSRLLQAIGWAAILPQMLATLGVLFDKAGVGKAVGKVTNAVLPHGWLLGAVIIYCVGMALFTLIMGNAFAAFPVMTAAIGWPVLVQQFHGNPAARQRESLRSARCVGELIQSVIAASAFVAPQARISPVHAMFVG